MITRIARVVVALALMSTPLWFGDLSWWTLAPALLGLFILLEGTIGWGWRIIKTGRYD